MHASAGLRPEPYLGLLMTQLGLLTGGQRQDGPIIYLQFCLIWCLCLNE